MFQNKQQHDLSTYWPAYSNPGTGQFNNATPELIPIPDEYYLPALKVQVDFAHMTFISNSSYYHRKETDSYQGTGFDLAYFQALGWPNSLYPGAPALGCGSASTTATEPCSWYPLLDGKGIHMPPGFANYATPNTMTNNQSSWTQEFRLQSSDPDARVKWTAGVFWQLAEELSVEQLNDPNINQLFQALYGVTADSNYGPYYSCPGTGFNNPVSPPIPNCSVYYNTNKSYDRQIAGFGEATIRLVDGLSLVAGARYSKLGFSLNHYSNGYENYGPYPAAGKQSNTAFTPRLGLDWQVNPDNLFYFTYAKGFRPGGFNAPLIPACGPGLIADGFSNGQAPLGYNPDSTQSFEVGSKNNFDNKFKIAASVYYIKWNNIQQNVYIAGNCGLQFTDNLGTAVSKGFDLQAQADLGSGLTFEFSAGYTDARFTQDSTGGLALSGEAISGNAAINYAPGTSPPWTIAFGPQYAFKAFQHDAFIRVDWEYTSRNPWLAPVQDPQNTSQYEYGFSYTLPATSFTSARAGMKFGGWVVSAFCDNLFNAHPVVNYAQAQGDAFNPAGPPTPQENDFTFRPRTVGITATLHL